MNGKIGVADGKEFGMRRWWTLGTLPIISIAALFWSVGKYWPEHIGDRPDMAGAGHAALISATPRRSIALPKKALRNLPVEEQINLAMATVFDDGPRELYTDADRKILYQAGLLLWEPFGAILILPGIGEATPVHIGTLGIFYLTEQDGKFVEIGRWEDAIPGSILGNPPDYTISHGLGTNSVIISTAGGVWQGFACNITKLTELRPEGPQLIAQFDSGYSNAGAVIKDDEVRSITGKVTNFRATHSFEVEYSGTSKFKHQYTLKDDYYERINRSSEQELPTC